MPYADACRRYAIMITPFSAGRRRLSPDAAVLRYATASHDA